MNYRLRKPETIPTIALLVVVAVTFYLGIWQLQRLAWKTDLLATIEKAQSQAPANLTQLKADELEKLQWHNIVATGQLQNDKELHITPRYLNGILGYGIMTPLAITTPQGTEYVLVNRGWVAPENKDANTRAGGNPSTPVTVEGAIRSRLTPGSGFTQDRFRPDNQPAQNLWYWYDMPQISKTLNLPLLPILIDATTLHNADGSSIKNGPQPFPIEVNIRNDHLGYAITWFLIGLTAIGVYLIYYTEKKK